MNVKNELISEIVMLIGDTTIADKLSALLDNYSISRNIHNEGKTIEKQMASFINAKRIDGLSNKTLMSYKQTLNFFANFIKKDVDQIYIADIREYLAFLKEERGLKLTSIQTHINILRSFFSWLVVEEVIIKNPMAKIRSQKLDRKGLRHALDGFELEKLRNACIDYREKALVEFFVSTGCRVSEVVNVRVNDVNWSERSLVVHGKGAKDRVVYFTQRTKFMLKKYIEERGDVDYLFTRRREVNTPIQVSGIRRIINKIGRRAGISQRVYPHLLRHTFATSAVNRGMDITAIQLLMGHEDVATTQIYATLSSSTVQHAYDKFAA